jgi:pimeloyl-ACP methyl ester carboxylesterase
MTLFIDLRASANGGLCAPGAMVWENGDVQVSEGDFAEKVRGRDLVLATHGFNVDRDHGIRSLSGWEGLCTLPGNFLFIGVLWPGDSRYLPVLDYPAEGDEAITSGRHLSAFLNEHAAGAASFSFVSHSLGGRVILETLAGLNRPARRLVLMAGAIENNCLVREYRDAAGKAEKIHVLASRADWVLHYAFPLGNPVGQLLMHGHPYFRTALGRDGPAQPIPPEQQGAVWQIPWDYVHSDYLPKNPGGKREDPPAQPPRDGDPEPPYDPAWSACVLSTVL